MINEEIQRAEETRILLDAPTLYESGADAFCSEVIAVLSGRENRKERILLRDGLTEAEAELRLNAGKSDEYYKDRTSHIIYNDGTTAQFKEKVAEILSNLEEN